MIVEIAGNSNVNSFGIYDAADSSNTVELYPGLASSGVKVGLSFGNAYQVELNNSGTGDTFADNLFGFYLDIGTGVLYSDSSLNSDLNQYMVGFRGNGSDEIDLPDSASGVFNPDDYIFGWEDILFTDGSDKDYNDFVISASSISPVGRPRSAYQRLPNWRSRCSASG